MLLRHRRKRLLAPTIMKRLLPYKLFIYGFRWESGCTKDNGDSRCLRYCGKVAENEKGQFFNCPFLQELTTKDEITNLTDLQKQELIKVHI
jgi:hypothetical protein